MSTQQCLDDISVIIVNYKTAPLTCRALESLYEEKAYLPNLRVVVIDNASPDNSYADIATFVESKQYQTWAAVIEADKNGGYAYGNNLGFAYFNQGTLPDYYWLLNPDTFVRPKAGLNLVNFLNEKGAAIAGSRLEDADGTAQISAFNFPSYISETLSGFGLGFLDKLFRQHIVVRQLADTEETVDWVAGASFMIPASVFSKVGMMDENYFLYFEEVDYCLHIQRLGFTCWYVPQSRVVHEVGAATGISDVRKKQPRRPQYWFNSRRRYFVKNFGKRAFIAADIGWATGYIFWCARKTLTRSSELDRQPPKLLSDLLKNSLLNPYRWKDFSG